MNEINKEKYLKARNRVEFVFGEVSASSKYFLRTSKAISSLRDTQVGAKHKWKEDEKKTRGDVAYAQPFQCFTFSQQNQKNFYQNGSFVIVKCK